MAWVSGALCPSKSLGNHRQWGHTGSSFSVGYCKPKPDAILQGLPWGWSGSFSLSHNWHLSTIFSFPTHKCKTKQKHWNPFPSDCRHRFIYNKNREQKPPLQNCATATCMDLPGSDPGFNKPRRGRTRAMPEIKSAWLELFPKLSPYSIPRIIWVCGNTKWHAGFQESRSPPQKRYSNPDNVLIFSCFPDFKGNEHKWKR